MRYLLATLTFIGMLASCSEPPAFEDKVQIICGRDDGQSPFLRPPLYRMRTPVEWRRRDNEGSVADSTLPICEFLIEDTEEELVLAVHHFPCNDREQGISPRAQIARWQRQFDPLEEESLMITPQSFSGFVGVKFEARGAIGGQRRAVIAWALEPAPEYGHLLEGPCRLADVTLKMTGSPAAIDRNEEAIVAAARSFEWIDEVSLQ